MRYGVAAVLAAALLAAGCGGGAGVGGSVTQPPPAVSLLDVQTQVFSRSCATAMCHAGPASPFGLDLSSVSASRANLVNVASSELATTMRVQPGNATDSYLYMKVVDDPRILGDRMPAGTPNPLGAGDLALIRTWIEDGAP